MMSNFWRGALLRAAVIALLFGLVVHAADAVDPIRARRIGGVAVFNPNNYGAGTLKAWFKADSLPLADGASVSTWLDSSGNGNNASGGTSPVYKAGIQNGKPGVLFTRTSTQYLNADGLSSVQSGTNLPYTLVVVFRQTSTAVTQIIAGWGNSASGNAIVWHQHTGGGNHLHRRRDNAASNKQYGATAIDTSSHVMTWLFDGSNGQFWRDGTSLAGPTDLATAGVSTIDRFSIGNNPGLGGLGAPFDGYQFEVLVYASALSTADRQAIERALGAKWGIAVA